MKIVILDGNTLNPGDLDWKVLEKYGNIDIYEQTQPSEVVQRSLQANVLIVNKVLLTREILLQLPNLQYVIVSATGYNNIDLLALKKLGIPASNVVNYGSDAVAQHTFALILELCNKVGRHNDLVQQGEWNKQTNFCFWEGKITELYGKTLGIIGMGSIGQKVAAIGSAFGMSIIYYSLSKQIACYEKVTLDELFAQSDILTLHTILHTKNEGIINKGTLGRMKKSAFLINTSRGKLVNEPDLKYALDHSIIAGAALDTVSEEPPIDGNVLFGTKNCIITPHNAWAAIETRKRMLQIIDQLIFSFKNGDISQRIC
ncbi:MAG: D-2-hydroxyacid dehydrogenase [Chitinophagales bacterium]|nr:D-2-hydroxyacid dehydrogenase [Chitinophagales bacterium]